MDKYIFYTGEPAYHEPLGGKKKFAINKPKKVAKHSIISVFQKDESKLDFFCILDFLSNLFRKISISFKIKPRLRREKPK